MKSQLVNHKGLLYPCLVSVDPGSQLSLILGQSRRLPVFHATLAVFSHKQSTPVFALQRDAEEVDASRPFGQYDHNYIIVSWASFFKHRLIPTFHTGQLEIKMDRALFAVHSKKLGS
jgi:hypothetical protein